MHVVQLLDQFRLTPHIEIIEAGLPERGKEVVSLAEWKTKLLESCAVSRLAAEAARDALLQDLHDLRGSGARGLVDQQVNVFGHDDVARQLELVAIAHFAEDFDESISGPHRGEQRQASIATAGDEMQVLEPVSAAQSFGHGPPKAPPFKSGRAGHPNVKNETAWAES